MLTLNTQGCLLWALLGEGRSPTGPRRPECVLGQEGCSRRGTTEPEHWWERGAHPQHAESLEPHG